MWREVNFGKWKDKNKTLPQILVSDPDWFFWALSQKVFKGAHAIDAQNLAGRARAIKLPPTKAGTHCVQHWMAPDGKYVRFDVIEKNRGPHAGSSIEIREPTLDLEFPRKQRGYDKLGCKLMMKGFKHHWLDGKSFTKKRVEDFFDTEANFETP